MAGAIVVETGQGTEIISHIELKGKDICGRNRGVTRLTSCRWCAHAVHEFRAICA